jgi:serine protease Do
MQLKPNYHLSLKTLASLILFAAFLGGGLIYFSVKSVTLGLEQYQQWRTEKHANPLAAVTDFFKKEVPQNVQPIKIIDEQSQVIEVVKKASPTVVSIVASAQVPTFETYLDTPTGLPEGFGQFFSVPQQRQNGTQEQKIGAGTGFLVSPDGFIVTNKHVVNAKEADYTVYLNNESDRGEKIKARVVALDPNNDLAILKIEKNNLPFLTFSDSSKLQVGQTVITIGYALGEFDNTVSKGVISGLARSITAGGGFSSPAESLKNLIQSDAAINPGNSGGPMLDIEGNVIGVNVAMASAENISFALLGNEAKDVFEQVRDTGSIKEKASAFLGVRYLPINDDIKNSNNLPYNYGALISRGQNATALAVMPGSPADKAGLVENDIILALNGQKITERTSLIELIAKYNPGDEVTLKIYHKGQEAALKITLGRK